MGGISISEDQESSLWFQNLSGSAITDYIYKPFMLALTIMLLVFLCLRHYAGAEMRKNRTFLGLSNLYSGGRTAVN